MRSKSILPKLYYAVAALALFATWYYNAQYLMNGGSLLPSAFFGTAFANSLTTAMTIDIYISGLVFSVWAVSDAKRHSIKNAWLYVLLCFGVGLAISLPLYLAVRERYQQNSEIDS